MTNKILTIINGLLFIGLVALYILFFALDGKPSTNETTVEKNDTTGTETTMEEPNASSKIAYIDIEQLYDEYQYYKELESEMEATENYKRTQLQNKAMTFQEQYQNYMQKASKGQYLSDLTRQADEEKLLELQKELEIEQQKLPEQLMELENKLVNKLYDSIDAYLQEFNMTEQYDFIIGNQSSILLHADESYNITDTVISALNARYQSGKAK